MKVQEGVAWNDALLCARVAGYHYFLYQGKVHEVTENGSAETNYTVGNPVSPSRNPFYAWSTKRGGPHD